MVRMEPLFRVLIVGIVPQPTEVPPQPFDREDLQKVFFEVSRDYPYSQFGLLSGDQGAQFLNPPHDRVLIQPQLLQVQSPIGSGGTTDTTAERSREKAVAVLSAAAERLAIRQFLSCGIKVQAEIPAPEGGARNYVATNLFHQADRVDLLGQGFFGGGIKVWRFDPDTPGQKIEILLVEPLLADDAFIYVDYDVQRNILLTDLNDLGGWIDSALKFVREKTITFLEEAS